MNEWIKKITRWNERYRTIKDESPQAYAQAGVNGSVVCSQTHADSPDTWLKTSFDIYIYLEKEKKNKR